MNQARRIGMRIGADGFRRDTGKQRIVGPGQTGRALDQAHRRLRRTELLETSLPLGAMLRSAERGELA